MVHLKLEKKRIWLFVDVHRKILNNLFCIFYIYFILSRWEHIIYQFGDHTHLIQYVLKHGVIVYAKNG
jgi:hypothetical protein